MPGFSLQSLSCGEKYKKSELSQRVIFLSLTLSKYVSDELFKISNANLQHAFSIYFEILRYF